LALLAFGDYIFTFTSTLQRATVDVSGELIEDKEAEVPVIITRQ
jgi:hypothetical protein